MNTPNDHINQLLEQCLDGTASNSQYLEAWEWVKASAANREYYYRMRDAWIAAGMLQPVAERDIETNWRKLEKQLKPTSVHRVNSRTVTASGTIDSTGNMVVDMTVVSIKEKVQFSGKKQ